MSNGTSITLIGRILQAGSQQTLTCFVATGGTITWTYTGSSDVGWQPVMSCSGTGSFSITGGTLRAGSNTSSGIIAYSGTGTFATTVDVVCYGSSVGVASFNACFRCVGVTTNALVHTGDIISEGNYLGVLIAAVSTFRWINQTANVPAGTAAIIWVQAGGTVDISGLSLQNNGKVLFVLNPGSTLIATAGTQVQNMTAGATAVAFATSALDGKIINVPASAPLLPSVADVSETAPQYGYAGSLLTGTARLISLATIEAGCASAITAAFADPEILSFFATVNTGQTAAAAGSVAALSRGVSDSQASQLALLQGIAAAFAGGAVNAVGRVSTGGRLLVYIGDDWKAARGTSQRIPVSDPTGGLFAKLTALTVANLQAGASRGGLAAGLIPITVVGLSQTTVGGVLQCLIEVELSAAGVGLQPSDDYQYHIQQRQGTDDFVEIEGPLFLRPRRVPAS